MKKLNRRQLTWYGIAGLGPNILNVIMGTYLCDALMIEGFEENVENWTYANKTLVVVGVWGILVTIAKIIDGFIDIPFGSMSDNLKSKWGNRKPTLLIGIIMMLVAYFMMLFIPKPDGANIFNTIWFGISLALFYSFYTLTMVTYYATFSEVTTHEADRVYLSNVKSTVDVCYFALCFAALPALIGAANIRILALFALIFMPSMIIPFVLIKQRSTRTEDVLKYKEEHPEEFEEENQVEEVKPSMLKAFAYAFTNKTFILWMVIYGALQFGLQMYLTGFNVYYSGTMGYSGMKIMFCNFAAFVPVPFTLILYNHIVKKKGFKKGFQFSLLMFSIGMIISCFCRPSVFPNETLRLCVSITAGLICSFGIGSFFSVSYTIPSQIAADEKAKKGLSYPAMYFAVQGLIEAGLSAISTGALWIYLKNVEPGDKFFINPAGGSGYLTLIVGICCLISLALTVYLPKSLVNLGKDGHIDGSED